MTSEPDKNVKVSVDIHPGPATPAQKLAWRKLWQKLIAEPARKESPHSSSV